MQADKFYEKDWDADQHRLAATVLPALKQRGIGLYTDEHVCCGDNNSTTDKRTPSDNNSNSLHGQSDRAGTRDSLTSVEDDGGHLLSAPVPVQLLRALGRAQRLKKHTERGGVAILLVDANVLYNDDISDDKNNNNGDDDDEDTSYDGEDEDAETETGKPETDAAEDEAEKRREKHYGGVSDDNEDDNDTVEDEDERDSDDYAGHFILVFNITTLNTVQNTIDRLNKEKNNTASGGGSISENKSDPSNTAITAAQCVHVSIEGANGTYTSLKEALEASPLVDDWVWYLDPSDVPTVTLSGKDLSTVSLSTGRGAHSHSAHSHSAHGSSAHGPSAHGPGYSCCATKDSAQHVPSPDGDDSDSDSNSDCATGTGAGAATGSGSGHTAKNPAENPAENTGEADNASAIDARSVLWRTLMKITGGDAESAPPPLSAHAALATNNNSNTNHNNSSCSSSNPSLTGSGPEAAAATMTTTATHFAPMLLPLKRVTLAQLELARAVKGTDFDSIYIG